ncbi:hypothetical protein SEVIR_5G278800v4 [Setaria viridis]
MRPPSPPSPPPPPPSCPASSALAPPPPPPKPNHLISRNRRRRLPSDRPAHATAPARRLRRVPGPGQGPGPRLARAGADRGRGPGRGSEDAGPGLGRGTAGRPGGALGRGRGLLPDGVAGARTRKAGGIGGTTTAVRTRRAAVVGTAVKWTTRGSLKDMIEWLVAPCSCCLTPAERVKAKMKLQLSETSAKDSTLGTATVRWERFEFNKDAPLDEDNNDVEVANDDASLVKNIGKSFRLSAVESKHEDRVRDAHEEAIFGVPTTSYVHTEAAEDEPKANDEEEKAKDIEAQPSSSLISDKVKTIKFVSPAFCLFPCIPKPLMKRFL